MIIKNCYKNKEIEEKETVEKNQKRALKNKRRKIKSLFPVEGTFCTVHIHHKERKRLSSSSPTRREEIVRGNKAQTVWLLRQRAYCKKQKITCWDQNSPAVTGACFPVHEGACGYFTGGCTAGLCAVLTFFIHPFLWSPSSAASLGVQFNPHLLF